MYLWSLEPPLAIRSLPIQKYALIFWVKSLMHLELIVFYLVQIPFWWGSPQWQIEAFRRFQIPEEMQEKFGYPEITDEDKAKILGLNAAKLYSIDVQSSVETISNDRMTQLKNSYLAEGGKPSNNFYGWVMT